MLFKDSRETERAGRGKTDNVGKCKNPVRVEGTRKYAATKRRGGKTGKKLGASEGCYKTQSSPVEAKGGIKEDAEINWKKFVKKKKCGLLRAFREVASPGPNRGEKEKSILVLEQT